jgi:hypothetical protein
MTRRRVSLLTLVVLLLSAPHLSHIHVQAEPQPTRTLHSRRDMNPGGKHG